jgi:hypothetical protein
VKLDVTPMNSIFDRGTTFILVFIITSIAIFYPKAGTLVASLSAFIGFFIIYLIPCVAHIKDVVTDGKY